MEEEDVVCLNCGYNTQTRQHIRTERTFANTPGEQSTLFILDPSGNALEFKSFRNIAAQLFAR